MAHATSLPPLSAGRKLADKFEIVGVLGEGGMGIVYDAHRLAEGDRVALKVIHQHLAGDPQIRGRFTREAAILRRLEGDHLCPVLDFGEVPDPRREGAGLLYMALPRIEGPALDTLLKQDGPLLLTRAVTIVLDICEALREAHAQGVIHRDLKPGNVLLRGGDRAVVVDFGMAKIVTGGGTGTTQLTEHNMVFGTPEYMAPEQARGDELDARCDVYATGIILYELLAGSVPFSGATPLYVLTAHLTAAPDRPRDRAPDRGISPALEAVVMHAIAKDPVERYATAGALAMAVRTALASPQDLEGVRPASRVNVQVDTTDAHSATLPAPVPFGLASVPMPRAPAPPVVPSVAPPDRTSPLWIVVCVFAALAGIALGAWLSMRNGR
ncbi:MAG TPA: serine/threonine-protein kinase [Polyangiaceae bacterium]